MRPAPYNWCSRIHRGVLLITVNVLNLDYFPLCFSNKQLLQIYLINYVNVVVCGQVGSSPPSVFIGVRFTSCPVDQLL